MSAFDNLTISGGMQSEYFDPVKLGASKGKSFSLEEIAADSIVLDKVDSKQISPVEAGIQPVNQDRFEKGEFDPRHLISNLFGAYSEKLYTVDYSYEKPLLPICNTVKWGIEAKGFDEDSIAKIAAEVGKRVDHLYKCGYYTDEEYSRLNEEIEYGTKQWVDELYDCRTAIKIEEERAKARQNLGFEAYMEAKKMSREERALERIRVKQQIMEENPPDFDALFALIEKFRNAGENKVEA